MKTNHRATSGPCTKYEVLLEDYISGNLEAASALSAAEHWKTCDGCRSALEDAAASIRLLRIAEPAADPSPAFSRTVMVRIRAAEGERSSERSVFGQPFVSLAWRFAATATLALCVLVTYDAGWGHRAPANATTAGPMPMTDIFAPDPGVPPADGDEVLMMVAEGGHGNQ
jgi:anti-sigma factor RsiW